MGVVTSGRSLSLVHSHILRTYTTQVVDRVTIDRNVQWYSRTSNFILLHSLMRFSVSETIIMLHSDCQSPLYISVNSSLQQIVKRQSKLYHGSHAHTYMRLYTPQCLYTCNTHTHGYYTLVYIYGHYYVLTLAQFHWR